MLFVNTIIPKRIQLPLLLLVDLGLVCISTDLSCYLLCNFEHWFLFPAKVVGWSFVLYSPLASQLTPEKKILDII